MSRYMPSANRDDQFNVTGHYLGGLLVEILKRCGDDFSSAKHEVESPVLLEGVSLSVGPKDYRSVKKRIENAALVTRPEGSSLRPRRDLRGLGRKLVVRHPIPRVAATRGALRPAPLRDLLFKSDHASG